MREVEDFSCALEAEFPYRSHLSPSIIFISTSCCDKMRFAYYVHTHVIIVFKFEVIANYRGLVRVCSEPEFKYYFVLILGRVEFICVHKQVQKIALNSANLPEMS